MNVVIGIDISKDKLDVLWLRDLASRKCKTKVFDNQAKRFEQLKAWLEKNTQTAIENIKIVIEATGIYHEAVANYLYDEGAQVHVVNPAFVRDYAKAIGARTKTDKKDSMVLALYGATQSLPEWKPESPQMRYLKTLLARIEALDKDIQRENNRLEKSTVRGDSADVITSIERMIATLEAEKQKLEDKVDNFFDDNPQFKKDRKLLETIPGVGKVISRYMVSLFRSKDFQSAPQMASFVGLVPIEKQSGKLVGKVKLAKNGAAIIRAKLYMAAVVATQYNPDIRAHYERMLSRGKTKMSALGGAMRKLVHICFGVLKHQSKYRPQVA